MHESISLIPCDFLKNSAFSRYNASPRFMEGKTLED